MLSHAYDSSCIQMCFRQCRFLEESMRANALASSLLANDSNSFCKKVVFHLNDCSNECAAMNDADNAYRQAKLGKSCGVDGTSTELFMYANNYAEVYLPILFTSCILHCHVATRHCSPNNLR